MNNKNTYVSILKVNTYEKNLLKTKIYESISLINFDISIFKNKKVLIKPNLLSPSHPDKAVSTHPEFVRAVAEIILDAGATITIGDSPGLGKPEKCYKVCGLYDSLKGLDVKFSKFNIPKKLPNKDGITVKEFIIAKDIYDADHIINLPKLKTHCQMVLTCATKNLYGIIPGLLKAKLHVDFGYNDKEFSQLILEHCYLKKPTLSIVDGIVAMEGNGPGSGTPTNLGIIAVSEDPIAVDRIITEIINFKEIDIPIFEAARSIKKGIADIKKITVKGDILKDLVNKNFKPATKSVSLTFLPPKIARIIKEVLKVKPTIDKHACTLCGKCTKICPVETITISNKKDITIGDKKCVYCFCCQEICPNGAITPEQNRIGKIITKLLIKN